jgi:hypothetical protein
MKSKRGPAISRGGQRPTRRDRLLVLLVSIGLSCLLILALRPGQAGLVGWIVMGAVMGVPAVAINVLFRFSHWEGSPSAKNS